MKSLLKQTLFASALILPGIAVANDFEAALSSETAQFTLRSDSSIIGWGGAELGAGFFYNNADDYVAQLSLLQRRQASEKAPLTVGVGVKAYVGNINTVNQGIFAIAIGGEVRYTIPGVMPMSVYLTANYAPKITSFSDTEEVVDTNLGFQIEVLPQTVAFVGFRNLTVNLKDGRRYDMDDGNMHVGVRLTF